MVSAEAKSDVAELAAAVRDLMQRIESQREPGWLSVDAAARYCSLSPKSIRNLISAGRIVPSRAVRGKVLIDRQQLDAALIEGCGTRLRKGRGIRRNCSTDSEMPLVDE